MAVHLTLGNKLAFACQYEHLSSSYVVLGDIQLVVVLAQRLICTTGDALFLLTAGAYETPDAATDQGGKTGAASDGYQFYGGHLL